MTLLDMVQRVLASIGSVNVDTVSGSMEAEQIALLINRVHDEILTYRDWTFMQKKDNPTALTDNYIFTLPDDLANLETVYFKTKQLHYIPIEDFTQLLNRRLESGRTDVDENGVYTDRTPFYYTSEAGNQIKVDAYDFSDLLSRFDITLYYLRLPQSQLFGDDDTFEIPQRMEPVLLNGVLALAYRELKGDMGSSDRYFNEYKKGLASMRRWARRIEETKPTYNKADYGRRGY